MRPLIVAMLLACTVSPALAGSRHAEEADARRIADRLNDPSMQSALSGALVAMTDMMMDLRIDTFRDAIARVDPDARADRDWDGAQTLGDVVARNDPYFRERVAGESRVAVGAMGAAASGMADMLPELRAMADRIGRQVEQTERRIAR